ncbi:probable inactive receptor kinase At5g10020 [Impatiens glandulifera]|uniref:probable inactive receptor kinase At5g10020 n=1 Tax=Impatiens glandulifera TaxID=253017 RepID=UPI001FB07F7D|nr:probable inactive receptor kinase At5g10020 [Impatiens glandulifera]
MRRRTLTVAHLFSLLFWVGVFLISASQTELGSLLEFKKGIQNDPLGKVQNSWIQSSVDPNSCPHSFYGVTCDQNGNVSSILLDNLGLVGDLKFSTLINLGKLTTLSLSGNSLSGRLVPALGSVTSLQHLDLSGNQFYGPIPDRINGLLSLNYLNLSSNNFTGGFPIEIRNLQQLKVIDLHSNELWGDIQGFFSQLGNIEHVDLSYNKFYGSLSMNWGNVSTWPTTLRYLNLSHNRLNGELFGNESVPKFLNLQVLDLGDNQLTGLIQSFRSLPSLHTLRLGHNQLFGPIPEELFQNLIPLEELDLSGNGFSGSITVINSTTLKALNLSSNSLSGSLPSSVGRSIVLDLSYNMFTGDISIMGTWESTLDILDLSSNELSGSIPSTLLPFQTFSTLIIRNNSLVGNLPHVLWNSPRLSKLDLSLNKLGGSIPPGLLSSTTLTNLNLSGNHFTGPIPFQGSHVNDLLSLPSYPPLESLDLSDNSLKGNLPSDVGNLGRIKILNLARNNLSGEIPGELSKLVELEHLDLCGNNFSGNIPDNLPSSLNFLNLSYNDLSGHVPNSLTNFPISSFRPGNGLLILPDNMLHQNDNPSPNGDGNGNGNGNGKHHNSKSNVRIAITVATIGATLMIAFVILAYYRAQVKDFHVRRFPCHANPDPPQTSLSYSNDHLLKSKSLSGQTQIISGETTATSSVIVPGRKSSPGSSPITDLSPRFVERSRSGRLDVDSPDRLIGELFFIDNSVAFTAEELSRAPAEVLGRSSHGTLYKATLDSGHMLSVKWLRVGLVKQKKEFAKEVKKIGSMIHPNIVPLRAYYWGPREQERLILADYIHGDNLALHLYETTPSRYSPLSLNQRLKVAVDVARALTYLHERGLPHGNLKPTNIILLSSNLDVRLTDYGLHRLMTPAGISEQILNLGALGYRAPELANTATKHVPTLKGDVYSFGVILMELLTRRSAGDIISGQSGAVDLTDWVRLCDQEGRGLDCIDRDIYSGEEEYSRGMDEMLAISIRCILPINGRPNMKQVFDAMSSISI